VKYWFAHHTPWQDFLDKADISFLVLGCMDLGSAFVIPTEVMKEILPFLNTTIRNGKTYWHIHIQRSDENSFRLFVPKSGNHLDLMPFMIEIDGS